MAEIAIFNKLSNIFRVPDLRKRVLFTLGLLAVYRIGGHIPTPGINGDRLAELGETEITPEVLKKAGVVHGNKPVKILGNGELKTAITVHAHKFSKSAQEKITKAGGKFEVLQ